SDMLTSLSESKDAAFEEEQLFLRVLVEGKASLYQYVERNLIRFYYSTDSEEMVPLIYKKYRIPDSGVGANAEFRRQLWGGLKCDDLKMERINAIRYRKSELISLFTDYNTCVNAGFVNYDKNHKRGDFNLTVRPRIFSGSLGIDNEQASYGEIDLGSRTGFALGLEAEFVLPFNKSKWALVLEPTYQMYKTDKAVADENVSGGILEVDMEYKSLEIPIGLRHYFFLNEQSKLFVNAFYVMDVNMDGSMELKRVDSSVLNTLDVKG